MTNLSPPATADEIRDAEMSTEDVPLVRNGVLTEAGELYVRSVREQA